LSERDHNLLKRWQILILVIPRRKRCNTLSPSQFELKEQAEQLWKEEVRKLIAQHIDINEEELKVTSIRLDTETIEAAGKILAKLQTYPAYRYMTISDVYRWMMIEGRKIVEQTITKPIAFIPNSP